jgi:O-antigen/teichoic acid export membrane protein
MIAKSLAFMLSFALPLLIVRRLDQREFGLYKQVFLFVGTALNILPLGFGLSAYYFLPREPVERQGAVVFNILVFHLAVGGLALLVLLVRPNLLFYVIGNPELANYAPLIGIVVLLWVVAMFLEIVTVAHQETKIATVFIVLAQLTKTALLLAAAAVFGSVRALIYAALIQGVLQTIWLLWYLRSRFSGFWRRFEWPMLRVQLAYALPIGVAGLLYTLLTDLHNYFVSNRFGAEAFALYSIGCFSIPLVGIISESIGSVMIPRVSYLQKQGGNREIILLTARVMRKLAVIYFPLYALLLVVAPEFITFLFTKRYIGSWPIFVINLTTLPFLIFVSDPIMRAYAEHRFFLMKARTVTTVVLFVALWFGTKYFGLVGAISIMVIVSLADRLVEAFKSWHIVGVTYRDIGLLKDIVKVAAAALIAALIAALVRLTMLGFRPFVVLAVCGIAFTVVYVGCIWVLGFTTIDEREFLRRHVLGLQRRVLWGNATDPLA